MKVKHIDTKAKNKKIMLNFINSRNIVVTPLKIIRLQKTPKETQLRDK